jgi:hypothetical protein
MPTFDIEAMLPAQVWADLSWVRKLEACSESVQSEKDASSRKNDVRTEELLPRLREKHRYIAWWLFGSIL